MVLHCMKCLFQRKNDTYEYLSGVAVTSQTQFLALNDPEHFEHFQTVIHYMHFALGAYGWPMFLMTHSGTGVCQLCTRLRYDLHIHILERTKHVFQ